MAQATIVTHAAGYAVAVHAVRYAGKHAQGMAQGRRMGQGRHGHGRYLSLSFRTGTGTGRTTANGGACHAVNITTQRTLPEVATRGISGARYGQTEPSGSICPAE